MKRTLEKRIYLRVSASGTESAEMYTFVQHYPSKGKRRWEIPIFCLGAVFQKKKNFFVQFLTALYTRFIPNAAIRDTHGLKLNRLNHANQPFWKIDQANRPNSYYATHDLHPSLKSD